MGRQKSVVGGQLVPFPASVSDKQVGAIVVPLAPAAPEILGTAQIPGGDVNKTIHFTCQLTNAAAGESVSFHLYRGAAEIAATDVYTAVVSGPTVIHCHWHDETPGAGQASYTVRVDGDMGAVTTVTSRRLTVEHSG
jgi:hypothetical protein